MVLENRRGNSDQIANILWIIKKGREFQKNIYFCFIDYAKAFDCVDHNKLQKILKEMGIPDHMTYFLRNLYAGQEATVKTGHGTTDWFQVGKGVHVLKWRDNQKAWASDLPQLKQQEKTLWGPSQARTMCKPGRELAAETVLLGSSNCDLGLLKTEISG